MPSALIKGAFVDDAAQLGVAVCLCQLVHIHHHMLVGLAGFDEALNRL
jgi:hypothetical protein